MQTVFIRQRVSKSFCCRKMNICLFSFLLCLFFKMMTLSLPSKTCLSLGQRIAPFLIRCSPIMCVFVYILSWKLAGCLYSIMFAFAFAFVFVHIIVFAEMIHTSEACPSLVQRIARGPCPATIKSALCHLRQGINS